MPILSPLVTRIFRECSNGATLRAIAKNLNAAGIDWNGAPSISVANDFDLPDRIPRTSRDTKLAGGASYQASTLSVGGEIYVALVTIFAGGVWRRGGIGRTGGLF